MTRALLSFGSNLGDRFANLRSAATGLGDELMLVSGVYETPPWGDPDQSDYLNAAAVVVGSGAADTGSTARTSWSGRPTASGIRSVGSARVRSMSTSSWSGPTTGSR